MMQYAMPIQRREKNHEQENSKRRRTLEKMLTGLSCHVITELVPIYVNTELGRVLW